MPARLVPVANLMTSAAVKADPALVLVLSAAPRNRPAATTSGKWVPSAAQRESLCVATVTTTTLVIPHGAVTMTKNVEMHQWSVKIRSVDYFNTRLRINHLHFLEKRLLMVVSKLLFYLSTGTDGKIWWTQWVWNTRLVQKVLLVRQLGWKNSHQT